MGEALQEILRRSVPHEEADFLPTVFGPFQDEAVKGTLPVVLYGAGSAGNKLLPVFKSHGVHPVCFCDINPMRAGESYCGLPVITLPELHQHHRESLVVVTTGTYRDQVKRQLVEAGFREELVRTIEDQEAMCYYTHLSQWGWPQSDLKAHEDDFQKVYALLADQRSRDLFVSRTALFVRGGNFRSFHEFLSAFSDVPPPPAIPISRNC